MAPNEEILTAILRLFSHNPHPEHDLVLIEELAEHHGFSGSHLLSNLRFKTSLLKYYINTSQAEKAEELMAGDDIPLEYETLYSILQLHLAQRNVEGVRRSR